MEFRSKTFLAQIVDIKLDTKLDIKKLKKGMAIKKKEGKIWLNIGELEKNLQRPVSIETLDEESHQRISSKDLV